MSEAYVYLFLVKLSDEQQAKGHVRPRANMPRVQLPVADPLYEQELDAVADPFVSQAYVYLFLVVDPAEPDVLPRAKIPLVEFPAAEPIREATLDAVAVPFVSHA